MLHAPAIEFLITLRSSKYDLMIISFLYLKSTALNILFGCKSWSNFAAKKKKEFQMIELKRGIDEEKSIP